MTQKGFSLIEVAIALIIIGVFAAAWTQTYHHYIIIKGRDGTIASQATVSKALADFVALNNRYPRPTSLTTSYDTANHGREVAVGDIPAAGTCNGGICSTTGNLGNPVLIGAVPYAALGIKYKATLDGWGNKLTYAVTQNMTVISTPFDPNQGAILLRQQSGAGSTGYNNTQAYLLVSHGENGVGAYSPDGGLKTACPAPGTNIEQENCNNDGTFIITLKGSAERTLQAGPGFSDDVVYDQISTAGSIWTLQANFADLTAKPSAGNYGDVGIGTDTPREQIDVAGNVRATNFASNRFCKHDRSGCFDPNRVGGTAWNNGGILCPQVGGFYQALTGLQNNGGICNGNGSVKLPAGFITGAVNTCDDGKFIKGVDLVTGDVICGIP